MPYWSNGKDVCLPSRSSGFNSPVRLHRNAKPLAFRQCAASMSGYAPDPYSGERGFESLAAHAINAGSSNGRTTVPETVSWSSSLCPAAEPL